MNTTVHSMRVLIIEDELQMAAILKAACEKDAMVADTVSTLSKAKAIFQEGLHDFVLLDRRLPDGDGASLIPFIRKKNDAVPVILLTGRAEIDDRVSGLDAGADDYIVKPFAIEELMARIRAISRRPAKTDTPSLAIGNMLYEFSSRSVFVDGIPLQLPRRQGLLLEALCTRARRTVLREWLIERAYGFEDEIQSNSLDSHISRLRKSLETAEASVVIHVIRGVGYLLKEVDNEN